MTEKINIPTSAGQTLHLTGPVDINIKTGEVRLISDGVIIDEGCPACRQSLSDLCGPVSVRTHPSAEVRVNGVVATGVSDVWPGSPGRVVRYWSGSIGQPHLCLCTPSYLDNVDGTTNTPQVWRQLIECDIVEISHGLDN